MTTPQEVPEYKVLENSFFEPDYVLAGSVVRTWASPGPHLLPLNDAAKAKMEEWYEEEEDEIDPKTRKKTGERTKPHAKYRIATYTPGEKTIAELVSGPPKDDPGTLSLSETMVRKSTDQRPPPKVPLTEPTPAVVVQAAEPATTAKKVA